MGGGGGDGSSMEMAGASGVATGNSRWNPTKEQISILENLYKQGIRTLSADQIHQITIRLEAYGTIEGKNVFYWFQNHKARQRQKQKQENLAYINRDLPRTQLVYPPPSCSNIACGPYFVPQADHHLGFYPQSPKVLLPGGSTKRRGRPAEEKMVKPLFYGGNAYDHMVHHDCNNMIRVSETENSGGALNKDCSCSNDVSNNNQETLPLFPLHPIGVCEGKPTPLMASPVSSSSCETSVAGFDRESCTGGSGKQPFFDFFSCQASTESD